MLNHLDIKAVSLCSIVAPRVLPVYATFKSSPSTKRFVAIGDAVAKEVTGISDDNFDAQLDAARAENANLIGNTDGRTAVHFLGSAIAPANGVISRHMLCPQYYFNDIARIKRIFVAYFLRQSPMDETLDIEIAGWSTAADIQNDMLSGNGPASFESSLKVQAVPVLNLFPIDTLPKLDYEFVF